MTPPLPNPPGGQDTLFPGDGLVPGTEIYSPDGSFQFKMQVDGNLVLYALNSIPVWNSGTSGHPEIWDVVMQSDGNFVMYNKDGGVIWATNTSGPVAELKIQIDGNVVMYAEGGQVLWATNTVVPSRASCPEDE